MTFKKVAVFIAIIILAVLAGFLAYYYIPLNFNLEKKVEVPGPKEAQDTQQEPPKDYTEEDIKNIAQDWIESKSPTYMFDGMNLTFLSIQKEADSSGYLVEYSFKSRYAGYGDRTSEMLAQVIVPHTITLLIENGKVVKAITDGVYDEMQRKIISLMI